MALGAGVTWHTTKEAAAYLRMTPSGVRGLVARGAMLEEQHPGLADGWALCDSRGKLVTPEWAQRD